MFACLLWCAAKRFFSPTRLACGVLTSTVKNGYLLMLFEGAVPPSCRTGSPKDLEFRNLRIWKVGIQKSKKRRFSKSNSGSPEILARVGKKHPPGPIWGQFRQICPWARKKQEMYVFCLLSWVGRWALFTSEGCYVQHTQVPATLCLVVCGDHVQPSHLCF